MDWFNDVDAAYRSELRNLNELNYARFEAKIDQRISDLRGELRAEMASLKADLIKWMFLFWAGTTFTVIGTLVALLKLF